MTFTLPGSGFASGRPVVAGLLAEGRIAILSQGNAAGQIGVARNMVSCGGVPIATVTCGASAAESAADAVIERLAPRKLSGAPTMTRKLLERTRAGLGDARFTQALPGTADSSHRMDVWRDRKPAFVDRDADRDLVSGGNEGTQEARRNIGSSAAPVFTPLTGGEHAVGFSTGSLSLIVGCLSGDVA